MKTILLFLVMAGGCRLTYAQSFTTKIGLGFGGKIEEKFHDCSDKSSSVRLMASVAQYYSPIKKYSIGLQLISSGGVFSIFGGQGGSCTTYDLPVDTTTLGNNNLNASSVLLRNSFSWKKGSKAEWYADLGVGITTYHYPRVTQDRGRVSRTRLAVSPQLGVNLKHFDVSFLAIFGGQTPHFGGFDGASQKFVSLSSIRSQQLYVLLQYDLFRF